MKTTASLRNQVITGTVYAGALLLTASSASAQNLFVESAVNPGSVYEYTPGGVPSTFTSTGLNVPYGMAFNSAGNLFVASCLDDAGSGGYITEITPGGAQSTFVSQPDPKGMAFNSAGNLFVTDYHSGNIYEYTPGGAGSIFGTVGGGSQALAFNSAGDLFVNSGYGVGNESIVEFTPSGTPSTFATGLSYVTGLAFNSAGDLFEADQGSGTIYEFTPGGMRSTFASLANPSALTFNSEGDLFVSAGTDVYEYTPGGFKSTFATGIDAAAGLAFQGVALPVPEPSTLALLALGASAVVVRLRRKA
jgi:hypothetical protein